MDKVCLVLEGGGMRGQYTIGVLDFFLENNIYINDVIGVSAGTANGASYLSRQKGRNYNINMTYANNKEYLSIRNLLKTGSIFNMDMLFRKIPDEIILYDYDAFNSLNPNFIVVITNCDTGKAEYVKVSDVKEDIKYLQASCSMPLVSNIVEIDNKKYLDGGISDSIPVKYMLENGFDKCVVIKTRDRNYVKHKSKISNIIKRKYKAYPKLVETINNRYKMYNDELEYTYKLEKDGRVFVIEPREEVKISQVEKNKEKLHDLYMSGYNDAKYCHKELVKFLGK